MILVEEKEIVAMVVAEEEESKTEGRLIGMSFGIAIPLGAPPHGVSPYGASPHGATSCRILPRPPPPPPPPF